MKVVKVSIILIIGCCTLFALDPDLEKYSGNPVMTIGSEGTWDSEDIQQTCVIKTETEYKMWYTAIGGGYSPQIGYATSPDGFTWTKYTNNPVLKRVTGTWDEKAVYGPSVIYTDSLYKMWYMGADNDNVRAIGYAYSSDGISWTKYENNPVITRAQSWEITTINTCSVIRDSSGYKMWYGGANASVYSIGYAYSSDGIIWTKYENNPVMQGTSSGWDIIMAYPRVFYLDDEYHMFYTGTTNASVTSGMYKLGYASSPDGITWTKYENNPILSRSTSISDWDYTGIWSAFVLWDSGETKLKAWYIGADIDYVGQLGYASTPPVSIHTEHSPILNSFLLKQNYPNPFNPVTTISYDLSKSSDVILSIYDINGRLLETLVNQHQNAGSYQMQWDASQNSSGLYFYRIQAGISTETRKMLFMK